MLPVVRTWLPVATVIAILALPASAQGDFQTLYDDYRDNGQIEACRYSSTDLSAGLSEIPADVREYDPGFAEAINAALEAIAAGCGTGTEPSDSGAGPAITAKDGSPGPPNPRPSGHEAAAGESGVPGVLIALIAILGATLAIAALVAAGRFYGWDLGRRLAPLRDAVRALGERVVDGFWAMRDRLGF